MMKLRVPLKNQLIQIIIIGSHTILTGFIICLIIVNVGIIFANTFIQLLVVSYYLKRKGVNPKTEAKVAPYQKGINPTTEAKSVLKFGCLTFIIDWYYYIICFSLKLIILQIIILSLHAENFHLSRCRFMVCINWLSLSY
eukprot:UN08009